MLGIVLGIENRLVGEIGGEVGGRAIAFVRFCWNEYELDSARASGRVRLCRDRAAVYSRSGRGQRGVTIFINT